MIEEYPCGCLFFYVLGCLRGVVGVEIDTEVFDCRLYYSHGVPAAFVGEVVGERYNIHGVVLAWG